MTTFKQFWAIILLCLILVPIASFAASDIQQTFPDSVGEGLIKYSNKQKKFGYLDIFGNQVIKAQFLSAGSFHNGLAKVQIKRGKYAGDQFIDHNGKVVIKPLATTKTRYYSYDDYWQGDYAFAEVWSVGKDGSISPVGYNYINEKGKLLNKEEYQYVSSFVEGYALVGTGSSFKKLTRMSSSDSDRKELWLGAFSGNVAERVATTYFYIDKNGEKLGNMTWANGRSFRDGMAAVAVKAGNKLRWGFINEQGMLQVSPEYDTVGDFNCGLAWVSDGEHYGYIDKNGDQIIPLLWDKAYNFKSNGFAVVNDESGAKIIDTTGAIILDSSYDALSPVANTDVYLANNGFTRGLIDRAGAILIPFSYRYAGNLNGAVYGKRYDTPMIANEFGEIIAPLTIDGNPITNEQATEYPDGTICQKIIFPAKDDMPQMCTFTDEKGQIISMNLLHTMNGENFHVQWENGKTRLHHLDGTPLSDKEWDGVNEKASNEFIICVKNNDFYGFVDAQNGKTVLAPQFTSVSDFRDGIAVAMLGNNATYIDSHARMVKPTITKNSKKETIKELQQLLADRGFFTGKATGTYSKQLTDAIIQAQTALGLPETGVADSDFQYALLGE